MDSKTDGTKLEHDLPTTPTEYCVQDITGNVIRRLTKADAKRHRSRPNKTVPLAGRIIDVAMDHWGFEPEACWIIVDVFATFAAVNWEGFLARLQTFGMARADAQLLWIMSDELEVKK